MFKKLLIATAVLATSSSIVFAGSANYKGDYKGERAAPCPSYSFAAGPYLGLSVGPRINYTGSPRVSVAIEGLLSAGYGMLVTPQIYLAGEVFGGGDANIDNYGRTNTAGRVTTPKSTWTYGASFIPGVMINDHVLGYLRGGVTNTTFTNAGNGTNSSNQSKTGYHVGGGAQTNVYQNWDLRGEYVFSSFGSVSGLGKPQSSQFNIGVVYKFV